MASESTNTRVSHSRPFKVLFRHTMTCGFHWAEVYIAQVFFAAGDIQIYLVKLKVSVAKLFVNIINTA